MNLSNVIFNQIILMNLFLTLLGIILFVFSNRLLTNKTKHYRYLFLFLVFYAFVFNEMVVYFTGNDYLYPGGARTEMQYSTGSMNEFLSKDVANISSNLTEGYYPGRKDVPPEEAERNRFDEFIRLLDIKKGESVLDAGCGFGGLVAYLRSKGIDAYGVTITKTQYTENIAKHGPYFFYGDYTHFHKHLENRFDHIILPGSLEHPFAGNFRFEHCYQTKYDGMKHMFGFMKKYFKKESKRKQMLVTCLHINEKYKDSSEFYAMSRITGCLYPPVHRLNVPDALSSAGYKVILNEDYSWHYYFASVSDPHHFGNAMHLGWTFYLISFWVYPTALWTKYVASHGCWMYQWDGKQHTPEHKNYSFEEDIRKRPCTLFYTVAKLNEPL